MKVSTRTVEETVTLGRLLGRLAATRALAQTEGAGSDVLCIGLDGPLGAGKTQLTRGIAEGAGVADVTLVSSPTYVLMNVYPGAVTVYHLDAYRVASGEDFAAIGLEEILAGEAEGGAPALVVMEWATRIAQWLPADRLIVRLEHGTGDELDGAGTVREVELDGTGDRSRAVVEGLREALAMRGLGGG